MHMGSLEQKRGGVCECTCVGICGCMFSHICIPCSSCVHSSRPATLRPPVSFAFVCVMAAMKKAGAMKKAAMKKSAMKAMKAAMKKAKKVSSVMKAMKGRAMRKAMKKAKATAEA